MLLKSSKKGDRHHNQNRTSTVPKKDVFLYVDIKVM